MKWSVTFAALALAAAPLAAQVPAAERITLQGCVQSGIDKGSVLMTDVTEVTEAGRSAVPTEAHGRKVIFWLDKDDLLKPHIGHRVNVVGSRGELQKSEIELKKGAQKDGGLVVEFEGPGHDVKASAATVSDTVGTTGRTPEKNDIPTFLFKVKVDNVLPLLDTCQ